MLTDDEKAAAKQAGMSPEKFEAMRGGCSLDEWTAMQAAGARGCARSTGRGELMPRLANNTLSSGRGTVGPRATGVHSVLKLLRERSRAHRDEAEA